VVHAAPHPVALQSGNFDKIDGIAEIDETFIGQSPQHAQHVRDRKITGTGGKVKTTVVGPLERGAKVRATVATEPDPRHLHGYVRDNVEPGATVYPDSLNSYTGLERDYAPQTVDHAEKCVDGQVHSNGMENFWSLLKRGLHGTYIAVEPFHCSGTWTNGYSRSTTAA
jgi:hypothetical protein